MSSNNSNGSESIQVKPRTEMVKMSNKQYDRISDIVYESYPNSCIVWIEQVINPGLEEGFSNRVNEVGIEPIEAFHGTKFETVNTIVHGGFDIGFNVRSAFGKGTYFANNAKSSFHYMQTVDSGGIGYMFLCDILMTETTTVSYTHLTLPTTPYV